MSIVPDNLSLPSLTAGLNFVVRSQRETRRAGKRDARSAARSLQARFQLANDTSMIVPAIEEIESLMECWYGKYDMSYGFPLVTSLEEALTNAIVHGNLEIASESKCVSGENHARRLYSKLVSQRRGKQPYRDRRVHIFVVLGRRQVSLVVRDEGPGFDINEVPDPKDPENLDKPFGRGLAVMHHFMDSVVHNDVGNVVTMIKRAPKPKS